MQINKGTLSNLFRGFKTVFFTAYQSSQENVLLALAEVTQSTADEEVYHWLGALPGMSKLIDEIKIQNVKAHNYTIPNEEWEDSVAVKRADIERDRYGIYSPMFRIMGDIARQHDTEQLAALCIAGFTENCYTGKPFFSLNHEPIKGGTKFSNLTAKKLSQANFRTGRENMRSRKNAAGRIMGLGRDLVLVVGPKNESLAREILKAERSDNGKTNVDKDTARIEISAELGGVNEDAWFLFDMGHPMKPFILQNELPIELNSLTDETSDHVFKKKEYLYQAYKRCGYGFGMPEVAYGSTGAAAA